MFGSDRLRLFLKAIYRNSEVALAVRLRAAIEALPCEKPHPSAVAGPHERSRLRGRKRAIERSGRGREIEQLEAMPPMPCGKISLLSFSAFCCVY